MAANVISPTHSPWEPCNSGMPYTHAPRATIKAHAPLLLHSVAKAMKREVPEHQRRKEPMRPLSEEIALWRRGC